MSFTVNTNIAALNAYQNLSKTQDAMNQSMQRLSSGYRINSAADDAAGFAISTGMQSQISGMSQAVRNTQDGISVVQTASGALNETTSILQRMRDLAVQAANGSNDTNSVNDIQTEVKQLQSELTRIGKSTAFNGINLLDGSHSTLTFQVGANSNSQTNAISVDLSGANVTTIASNVTTKNSAATYAITTPSAVVSGTYNFKSTPATGTATTAAVTLAAPTGGFTSVQQVADALNSNSAFNTDFTASVDKNNNLVVGTLDGGTLDTTAPGAGIAAGTSITGIDLTTQAGAQSAIATLDAQIQTVSTAQAQLGAYQNRFTHTINNLNTAIQNTTASQSRIRDTDMAQEMTNFSKSQILVQAGTAMLAQANQSSQGILKLLG